MFLSNALTHFFLPIDFFRDSAHRISCLKPQIEKRSDMNPSCGKIHERISAAGSSIRQGTFQKIIPCDTYLKARELGVLS